MGENLFVGDDENDVAQLAMFPQHIDRLRVEIFFTKIDQLPPQFNQILLGGRPVTAMIMAGV